MSVQFILEDLSRPDLLRVNLTKCARYQPGLLQILLTEGPPPDDLHQGGEVDGGRQVKLLHHLQPPAQSPQFLAVENQLLIVFRHLFL